eukprot:12649670-Ditylum_brightwellii.AAC.1
MNKDSMKAIVAQVPTSMEELSSLGILGENIEKEYGKRLIENIMAFIELENLQKYIGVNGPKRRRTAAQTARTTPAKRPLVSK